MVPVIALVGRPNVGKSTLFNRLTRSRDAIVADFSGLTRDRQYGHADFEGRPYILIDTGGITGEEQGIDLAMAEQSRQAILEADVVFFLLDARAGLSLADETLAQQLRQTDKPVYYLANKIDGIDPDVAIADFFQLGIAALYPITATHGRGVKKLMQEVFSQLPETTAEEELTSQQHGVKIAILGRPNVGKSTLVNRLLGEERVVVYDQPGTTRDSIYIHYSRNEQPYTLIDTAGVRRRKNVKQSVEKFSIVKTLKAIDDAHVVVLVMDARENIVDQDLHLLGHAINAGRAVVLAVNKWDGLEPDQRDWIKAELERRLQFIDYADIHFISALHGTGVGHLYESIDAAYAASTRRLSTRQLTTILEGAVSRHPPPLVNGRRIKLRYAHAGGHNPPIIVIHGNQTDKVPANYRRYLEKWFREQLGLEGTPVKLEFKTSENPFAHKRNQLTKRQVNRKRRLMKYVKKKK